MLSKNLSTRLSAFSYPLTCNKAHRRRFSGRALSLKEESLLLAKRIRPKEDATAETNGSVLGRTGRFESLTSTEHT